MKALLFLILGYCLVFLSCYDRSFQYGIRRARRQAKRAVPPPPRYRPKKK